MAKKSKEVVKQEAAPPPAQQEVMSPADLATEALDYRRQGFSYEQIAEAMNIDRATAITYVAAALSKVHQETEDQRLKLDIARLEQLMSGIYASAAGGDLPAIAAVCVLMDRIERLASRGGPTPPMAGAPMGGLDFNFSAPPAKPASKI